jgi:mannose-6-phosphate isomerase
MKMTDEGFYPFLLRAVAKEKVWGGRNLERLLNKNLPPGALIGETWEAWEGCAIENGKHQGRTLGSLLEKDGEGILGAASAVKGRFPLLFKFIDAQDDLSVQVHPNDAGAQVMEGQPFGKTEAWYILHSEPSASLILGFSKDAESERLVSSIRDKKLTDLLSFVQVQRGDVLFVPAGTVHAIGKGIVLAEIQENSDITYRLYDWGRAGRGRDLHIAQALEVLECKPLAKPKIPSIVLHHESFDQRYLVACKYFGFELLQVHKPSRELMLNEKFHLLSIIEGEADILFGQGLRWNVSAKQGQTLLLPARLGVYAIWPTTKPCNILKTYIPDLKEDVVEPLARAGCDAASIVRLGGSLPEHNDLLPLLQG